MTTDEIMLAELQAQAHEVYQSAYTVGQAAHILHVKADTLKPLIESGEIETVSYGGKPKRITPPWTRKPSSSLHRERSGQ